MVSMQKQYTGSPFASGLKTICKDELSSCMPNRKESCVLRPQTKNEKKGPKGQGARAKGKPASSFWELLLQPFLLISPPLLPFNLCQRQA